LDSAKLALFVGLRIYLPLVTRGSHTHRRQGRKM